MRKRFVIYALSAFLVIAAAPAICASASDKEESIQVEKTEIVPVQEPVEEQEVEEPVTGESVTEEPENDNAESIIPEKESSEEDGSESGQKSEKRTDIFEDEAGNDVSVIERGEGLLQEEEIQNKLEAAIADFFEKDVLLETGKMEADSESAAQEKGFIKTDKGTVYYDENGSVVTGEKKIDGYWYYFDETTGLMHTGYRTKGKNQLYYNSKGRQIFGAYKGIKYWYYFNKKTGARLTGWRTSGKNKYYYNSNGRMVTGCKKIGKFWYYFNKKSGAMHKGLRKSGKNTYYYDTKGHLTRGAHKINGKWYYFESNGKRTTSQAKILAIKVLEKRGWSLRKAFNYSARSLRYVPTGRPPRGTSHADWYATRGFKNKGGNCYVMASTFVQMARVMGYRTYLVEGSVPSISGGYTPHGWCEIIVKGTKYVCDPDFTHETGRNGYMIRYRQPGTWVYVGYRRVK